MYDLFCPGCGADVQDAFLGFRQVERREFPPCPECGTPMAVDIGSSCRNAHVSGHGFRPYFNRGLGVTVTSAAQQDRTADKLGLKPMERGPYG